MFKVNKIDIQNSVDIESWPPDLGGTWPDLGDLWKGLTLGVMWSTPFISLPCPSSSFIFFSKSHYLKSPSCLRDCKVIIVCSTFRSIWFFWFFAPAQSPNEVYFTHKASHKRGLSSTCSYVLLYRKGHAIRCILSVEKLSSSPCTVCGLPCLQRDYTMASNPF